jgi:erythronate-4-phosphate dehydrogenase
VSVAGRNEEDIIAEIVRRVYDVEKDDAMLRSLHQVEPQERGAFFDRLRKEYPVRREFHNTEVVLPRAASHLVEVLSGLGFRVRESGAG